MEGCGAYIGAIPDRQAIKPVAASDIKPPHGRPSGVAAISSR
jgi:hypothetical protein